MMVLKPYWGQGIARRMLEVQDDHAKKNSFIRIEAMVRSKNERGVNLYRNAGYSIEGTRKQAALIHGEYWDEYFIAKLFQSKSSGLELNSRIETQRLILRLPSEKDIPQILRYFQKNESHFATTDPLKPPDFYTSAYWNERVRKAYEEFLLEQSVRFFLFNKADDQEVVGTVNFTQFFRGPFQACYLGYGLSKSFEGQGMMTEGLSAAINYIFQEKNIHRVMANYLDDNIRSANLLKRVGFIIEGRAREYLFINGTWKDHVLTALTYSKWKNIF